MNTGIQDPRAELYEPHMTFREIAEAMNIAPSTAQFLFESGMRKLRARPRMMAKLAELVAFRERMSPNPRVW